MTEMAKHRPPQALVKELRHSLASAIADFKSYHVVGICERIGLPSNSELDPFNSKYKYAMACIMATPVEVTLETAWQLLAEEQNFQLSEAARKLQEFESPSISEITRRRIFAVFNDRELCTEVPIIELLRRLWPIDSMKSTERFSERTLVNDISKHVVDNDDWTNRELLEKVGAVECSQTLFFDFLSLVTDPLTQKPETQAALVEKINAHLVHDNYKLTQVRTVSGCPIYEVRTAPKGSPADDGISVTLRTFDPANIHARWEEALKRRSTDPRAAITVARTLLGPVVT